MFKTTLQTLIPQILKNITQINIIESIIYFLINIFLAYFSYKIFKLIGENYSNPKKPTKKLMNFFIFSLLYFFASSLFEILTIYFSLFPPKPIGLIFNYTIISAILFSFYILLRYQLLLSIYYKFQKPQTKTPQNTSNLEIIKKIILFGVLIDFLTFFYIWYFYDFIVSYYNFLIFSIIFFWIIRHNDKKHAKIYSIYFLLLFLIFNRMNFMFLDFSKTKTYYIFDLIISIIIISAYIIIYRLIKNNKNILEK